jgi:hypothetical protein
MKDNGKYFHAILGVNDKQNVLPAEIGKDILCFCHFVVGTNGCVVVGDILDYFEPQKAPSWDPQFCGDDLSLKNSNHSVTKNTFRGNGCGVQSAQPCTRYSVQIVKGQNLMIGLAPRHGFDKNGLNFKSCGWYFHVLSGKLMSRDGAYKKAYCKEWITEGSLVTVIHDTRRHTIEFQVNGKSLGIAFRNIPRENLYAAADFPGSSGTEIRIVDDYS